MAYFLPIEVTIKDIPNTESVESRINKKAEKLTQFYDRIEFCKVVVNAAQKHKHQGKLYTVHIEMGVPGKTLVANHNFNQNLYIGIRQAFDAIKRQLEDYVRKQRGEVKKHPQTFGVIARLFEDYGFIQSEDGREYYFHALNVISPKFEHLDIGMPVSFIEAIGGDGLQANHIICVTESFE